MNITYRQLSANEAERIKELAPSDFIQRAWRSVNGVKQWVEINWKEDDFPDGYEHHLAALKATFEGEGYALGAFDGERLIGFCSINREIFGSRYKYVLLDQLFIAPDYKRKGIGKKLFMMCADIAKSWGANKYYISAGSSEATLAFYISLGCEHAMEINPAMNDPESVNDIVLEYNLNNMPPHIKADSLYITKFLEATHT